MRLDDLSSSNLMLKSIILYESHRKLVLPVKPWNIAMTFIYHVMVKLDVTAGPFIVMIFTGHSVKTEKSFDILKIDYFTEQSVK